MYDRIRDLLIGENDQSRESDDQTREQGTNRNIRRAVRGGRNAPDPKDAPREGESREDFLKRVAPTAHATVGRFATDKRTGKPRN